MSGEMALLVRATPPPARAEGAAVWLVCRHPRLGQLAERAGLRSITTAAMLTLSRALVDHDRLSQLTAAERESLRLLAAVGLGDHDHAPGQELAGDAELLADWTAITNNPRGSSRHLSPPGVESSTPQAATDTQGELP